MALAPGEPRNREIRSREHMRRPARPPGGAGEWLPGFTRPAPRWHRRDADAGFGAKIAARLPQCSPHSWQRGPVRGARHATRGQGQRLPRGRASRKQTRSPLSTRLAAWRNRPHISRAHFPLKWATATRPTTTDSSAASCASGDHRPHRPPLRTQVRPRPRLRRHRLPTTHQRTHRLGHNAAKGSARSVGSGGSCAGKLRPVRWGRGRPEC